MGNIKFLQGNEAIALGALKAGCDFFAGYPITPSSEVATTMSIELPKIHGKFIQMEDEIASLAACIGASFAGKKTMTATSGPGISLMTEGIGVAIMTEAPVVIINAQRGGPSTGQATKVGQGDVMQARWGSHGGYPIIAISPSTVEECYIYTIHAFNFAERYRIPVFVLSDEVVSHMKENIDFTSVSLPTIINRKRHNSNDEFLTYNTSDPRGVPPMVDFGGKHLTRVSTTTHDKRGWATKNQNDINFLHRRLYNKIMSNREDIVMYETDIDVEAKTLVVGFGCSFRSSKQAIIEARKTGKKVSLFRPIILWPFPDKELKEILRGIKRIVVPEISWGQISEEIKKLVNGNIEIVKVNHVDGTMITPEEIIEKVL
jgi:2-oxoglutarate ferredoxin oxidoreductase subunit alpha